MPNRRKNGEYDARMAVLLRIMQDHIKEDSNNFKELTQQILEVNKDVKSLLASRSFLQGAWFALGVGGTLIATIVSLIVSWFKH